MIRVVLTVLSILPWWAYALMAYGLGSLALDQYETYQSRVVAAERAIRAGPPPLRTLPDLHTGLTDDAFRELQVRGTLRADLGVGQLDGTLPKSYVVLDDPGRTGPVLAVLFVGRDAQEGLADLVAASDGQGGVTASGFRRTLDRAAVAGQLRLQGVRREVVLMEALVGDRAAALRAKATNDLPFIIILAGLAGISALAAVVRFVRWRSRTSAQRPASSPAPSPVPVDIPSSSPAPPAPATSAPAPVRSPWGGIPPARADGEEPAATLPESPEPAFQSVFPGGGSGFRFKTVDEIIRQSFGTVSTLDRSKDPKPGG